ncbi:hypothetical protein BHE74_00035013 [Ensete ventricosum]|nr:hypothetical protein GW17_00054193 [Ensete ventricosum]RWW58152.1 hypothetical protein BHE74_00035013 [Ensete ventricosum]
MGLITHNRIYVCISTSLCPAIVDLVVISSVGSSPLRASYSRPPLRVQRCKRLCPRVALLPASDALRATGLPCGLALAAAGRHLVGGLGRGPVMDG